MVGPEQTPEQEGSGRAGGHTRVILVGLMGVGKTTVGRALARRLHWEFVDSDHEIQRRTGVGVPTIFEIEGEAGFRRRERAVLTELCDASRIVLATGGGAVLNPDNRALLKRSGLVVYLSAPAQLLWQRTRHDRTRPLLQVPDPLGKLRQLLEERDPLYRDVAHLIINVEHLTQQQIVSQLDEEVRKPCAP